MPNNQYNFVGIVPYDLRKYSDLSCLKLDKLFCNKSYTNNATIGTLTDKDHIVIYASSRIIFEKLNKLPCKLSLIMAEPYSIHNRYYKLLWLLRHKFYRVFTNYTVLSSKYSNVLSLPLAYTWVSKDTNFDPKQKNNLISLIASKKNDLVGHKLRHKIINTFSEPIFDLIGSGFKPFNNKEDGLLPYMYSIVIENCQERDYFTEKIVDCLICGTIPIYWGAPNIGDHFEVEGIIIFNSIEELREILNTISDNHYLSVIKSVHKNRSIARDISRVEDNIISILETT